MSKVYEFAHQNKPAPIPVDQKVITSYASLCGFSTANKYGRAGFEDSEGRHVYLEGVHIVYNAKVGEEGVMYTPSLYGFGNPSEELGTRVLSHYGVKMLFVEYPEGKKAIYMAETPPWVTAYSHDDPYARTDGSWMFEEEAEEAAEAFIAALRQKFPQKGMISVSAADLRLALEAAMATGEESGSYLEGCSRPEGWGPNAEQSAASARVRELLKVADEAAT